MNGDGRSVLFLFPAGGAPENYYFYFFGLVLPNASKMKLRIYLLLLLAPTAVTLLTAQPTDTISRTHALITYGSKGFQFTSADSNYLLQLQWRGQFRVAYPTDSDPITLDDFDENKTYLKINRARMKVGGHAYRPWFAYYLEYELFAGNLLDFRIMFEQFPFLQVKVGQWKAQYNRERIISSGKQQTLDRSLLTRAFTIDRQQGISLFGRLDGEGLLDFNYWISAFMGTGRGATGNDDEHLMWMTRWQWNVAGDPLEFTGSDTDFHEQFTAILALAAVTNRSPYTRFSQAGGGQLEGFEEGAPGQYRIHQWLFETAAMYRGFSWQQEFHWKQINDLVNDRTTLLTGNLIQLGYFFHNLLPAIPPQLELYGRHAIYDPDRDLSGNFKQEFSFGANWFIREHLNKLTAEISLFDFQAEVGDLREGWRFRLQWDVSF